MKKIMIFAAIFELLLFGNAFAQNISPLQLKEARHAAYQWMRDYNVYAKMDDSREPEQKFYSLFLSNDVVVVNDYLPAYSEYGKSVTVETYAELLRQSTAFYVMSYKTSDFKIMSESYVDEVQLEYIVTFRKTVSFAEKDNQMDNRYAYPSKTYKVEVKLLYDVGQEAMLAKEFSTQEDFGEILILHDENTEFVNRYVDTNEMNGICARMETPLVKSSYSATDFDKQVLSISSDTLKNSFSFAASLGGVSFYTASFLFDYYEKFRKKVGMDCNFEFGYYRQLYLKDKHRFGIELAAFLSHNSYGYRGKYQEIYSTIDPDGGVYDRIVEIDNYTEKIKRLSGGMHLGFKYEYFIKTNLSLSFRFGAFASYDIKQNSEAHGTVEYSGYYDWLFDVVISQNGIYDFGVFQMDQYSSEIANDRLNVGVYGGIGVLYYIPQSICSVGAMIQYSNVVYNPLKNDNTFHLTERDGDWTSSTYMLKTSNNQNISFMLNFNVNF